MDESEAMYRLRTAYLNGLRDTPNGSLFSNFETPFSPSEIRNLPRHLRDLAERMEEFFSDYAHGDSISLGVNIRATQLAIEKDLDL
jgi:hypothetical protein